MNLQQSKALATALWHSVIVDCLVLVGIAVFSVVVLHTIQPELYNAYYTETDSTNWIPFQHPFSLNTEPESKVTLRWSADFSAIVPKKYRFIPDDCITELTINNQLYSAIEYPLCDWNAGVVVDIADYVQPGENTFTLELHNSGGAMGFRVAPVFNETINLVFQTFLYLSITLLLIILTRSIVSRWLRGVIILGVLLRLYYYSITLFYQRAYDVDGHISYILDFSKNLLSLPALDGGWIHYHPPVYHYLGALLVKVFSGVQQSSEFFIELLQLQSLVYSLGAFAISVLVSGVVFSKRDTVPRVVFVSLCATLGSFVMFSARINNDVLVTLLQFGFFLSLLHWWRSQNPLYFYSTIVLAAFAILTKTNSLLLLPILYACLLFSVQPWRHKVLHFGLSLNIIAVLTGWFFVIRFIIEHSGHLVGNIQNLDSALMVSTELENLMEYNPIRMIKQPYFIPYDISTTGGYFLEALWKTAFFGEFDHDESLKKYASVIIGCSQILLLYAIRGLYITVKHEFYRRFPIIITSLVIFFGHLAFRITTPYAPVQDFRYSVLLLLPMAFYIAYGIKSSNQLFRNIAYLALIILLIAQVVFTIRLGW